MAATSRSEIRCLASVAIALLLAACGPSAKLEKLEPGLPPSVPAFYGELAAELKVPFEEASIRAVVLDNRLKSDLVHPNAQGYAQIAEAV